MDRREYIVVEELYDIVEKAMNYNVTVAVKRLSNESIYVAITKRDIKKHLSIVVSKYGENLFANYLADDKKHTKYPNFYLLDLSPKNYVILKTLFITNAV